SNGGSSWTQIAQVGAGVTTYTDTTVSKSKSYSYRVCAYNAGGNSAYSNIATVTTPKANSMVATAAPLAPAPSGSEMIMPSAPAAGPAHGQAGASSTSAQGTTGSPPIASRFDLVDWALADWPRHPRVVGQALKRTT